MQRVVEENEAVLVFCADGSLHPCYGAALQLGEGWPHRLKKKYVGGVLATEDAHFRIESLKILAPWGSSLPEQIFGFLNMNWKVEVNLKAAEVDFYALRELLGRWAEDNLSNAGDLKREWQSMQNFRQIFQGLRIDRVALEADEGQADKILAYELN